jgi:D-serine deaminase-like pyridoxal phosphate-dependent protein
MTLPKLSELSTPILLADMDVIEGNISTMSCYLAGRHARLRPHFKNHRTLPLARRQIEAGAIGLTVARLSHAELLLRDGTPSVLLSNEVVDRQSIRRIVDLAASFPEQELLVVVDNSAVVREMAGIADAASGCVSVLVDVDLGLRRTGVQLAGALDLVKEVVGAGLRFRGLFGYEGHLQKLQPVDLKAQVCFKTLSEFVALRRYVEQSGYPVEILSSSGTGSMPYALQIEGITEIQAGSYLFMETGYEAAAPSFNTALTVLATAISKTDGQRVVIDAGIKALSAERGMPTVKDRFGFILRDLNAEHGIIDLAEGASSIEVGDRIEVWVHYSDATVNLHRQMYGIRGGVVEQIFTIEANG